MTSQRKLSSLEREVLWKLYAATVTQDPKEYCRIGRLLFGGLHPYEVYRILDSLYWKGLVDLRVNSGTNEEEWAIRL